MKKTLLTFAAATAALTAAAAPAIDYTKVWAESIVRTAENEVGNYAPVNFVDAEGNVISSTAIYKSTPLPDGSSRNTVLRNVITKYDAAGKTLWSFEINGAAIVNAITTDSEGNIYFAGTLADIVEFGTTSGEPIEKEGVKLYDYYSYAQDGSFIAYYSPAGAVQKVDTYLAEPLKTLLENPAYHANPKDNYFHINSISVDADKNLYCTAHYTGETHVKGADFVSNYDDMMGWGCIFAQMGSGAAFKVAPDGTNTALVTCTYPEAQQAMDYEFEVYGVNGVYADGAVYTAFSTNGALTLTTSEGAVKVDNEGGNCVYYVTKVDVATGALTNQVVKNGYMDKTYNNFHAIQTPENVFFVGSDQNEETFKTENFILTAPKADISTSSVATNSVIDGIITYRQVLDATVDASGNVAFISGGYYNQTEPTPDPKPEGWKPSYRNGEFANVTKGFTYANGTFSPLAVADTQLTLAAGGSYLATGANTETGATVTLYKGTAAGIEGVTADSSAPAEYFNLQGIRVAAPTSGLYIRRQGNTATKVLVK